MDIITSVAALRERLEREPDNVFVPTMGNLHQGHIQLMRLAKRRAAACTVVSIFVNRLQFGPKEDFERYPRTLQSDSEKMKDVGVDVVFAPDEAEIYPEPQTFVVEPSDLQHILESATSSESSCRRWPSSRRTAGVPTMFPCAGRPICSRRAPATGNWWSSPRRCSGERGSSTTSR